MFYSQERVGKDGNTVHGAEVPQHAHRRRKGRRAAMGGNRTIRASRASAASSASCASTRLPQMLNVLKGDMSFVGPRPERPYFVEQLCEEVPYYDVRHSVKPGITGWAQVRYPYGASVEDALQKLQYDLYYVKNNSLFLDLLILIDTLQVVLLRKGSR